MTAGSNWQLGPVNTPKRDFARNAAEAANFVLQASGSDLSNGLESHADPNGMLQASSTIDFTAGSIEKGTIRTSLPHIGSYTVSVANNKIRVAKALADGGFDISARGMRCYELGADVLIFQPNYSRVAVILGLLPKPRMKPQDSFCDLLSPGGGVGYYASPQYSYYVAATVDGGAGHMTEGDRPYDALSGDYTVMTSNGVGLHIDTEMMFVRTSEVCGLFLFREDGHTRLSGETLQLESIASRSLSGVEVYECFNEQSQSVYPWEAIGLSELGEGIGTIVTGEEAIHGGPLAPVDAENPDVRSIDRIESFGGYLGQGQLLVLSCVTEQGTNTWDSPLPRAALCRQQTMLDGTYLLETTRQLFLAKTADIPYIRRTKPIDYLDENESYQYSGAVPVGEDADQHIVKPIDAEGQPSAHLAIEEGYAYVSAWQGLHAAVYHPNIEITYREDENGSGTEHPQIDVSQTDRAAPVTPVQVPIDSRLGEIDIYRILSFFAILPDGSLAIRNGQGAEIRLGEGAIDVTGLSININAAKQVTAVSDQLIFRSHGDTEIVSSEGSVRVKAQTDLNLLGAAGGSGGVLIESRSESLTSNRQTDFDVTEGSGVVIKSATSHVTLGASALLLKTGGGSSGLREGPIVIDAGADDIVSRAASQHRYASNGYWDNFGTGPGTILGTNSHQLTYSRFNGAVGVNAQLLVGDVVQAGGSYHSLRGYFFSPLAPNYNKLVETDTASALVDENLSLLADQVEEAKQFGEDTLVRIVTITEEKDRPLHPETIKRAQFGFPSSDKYGASQLQLRQPFWQRMLPADSVTNWEEPDVVFVGQPTKPWPGRTRWAKDGSFLQIDPNSEKLYFDAKTSMPKDPSDKSNRKQYESAEFVEVKRVSLEAGFKTLKKTR